MQEDSAAAGLSIKAAQVADFKQDFEKVASQELSADDLIPRLEHDGEVELADLHKQAVLQLSELAPFGIGNPQPSFVSRQVEVYSPQVVGEKHLRFTVAASGVQLGCIAFGMADRLDQLQGQVDSLFRPEINSFRGRDSVQLQIADFRAA